MVFLQKFNPSQRHHLPTIMTSPLFHISSNIILNYLYIILTSFFQPIKLTPPLPPHLRDQFLNQSQLLSQICRFLTLFMVSFFSKCNDTFSSAEGVGHFADAPLEHNKSYSYPILFAFLLKLQFAITI